MSHVCPRCGATDPATLMFCDLYCSKPPRTIGDEMVAASKSGDHARMREVMGAFWKEAAKKGMPTPATHPPKLDGDAP